MAKKQTRGSISVAKPIFEAIIAAAAERGLPAAHFVEQLVRTAIPDLPTTAHLSLERVERAQRGKHKSTSEAVAMVSAVPSPLPPAEQRPLSPSTLELAELRIEVAKTLPSWTGNGRSLSEVQSRERKVSRLFAAELRKRGWLAPEREGYAAKSWSAA